MSEEPADQIIHQNPLAYLLGLEGIALMRAFAGEYDRAFTDARIAEVRELLDRTADLGPGVDVAPLPVVDGYDGWAMTYDGEDNGCFPMRDDLLAPMLDRLPVGRVLDAACGTGAVVQQLVARGNDVIGVDVSPAMLARARTAVPKARLVIGDLRHLPLPDADVDHVVCSLALTHVRELDLFFAETARVMRPGGHLILLDTRGHFTGSYRDDHTVEPHEMAQPLTPGTPDIWELHPWVHTAANAAKAGQPAVIAWDFELRPDV